MDDGVHYANIIIFVAILLIDMIYYCFGAALQHIDDGLVAQKVQGKDPRALRIKHIIELPDTFVNTVQLVSLMIHLGMAVFFVKDWISFSLLCYLVLTFGILIPKKVGERHAAYICFGLVNIIYATTIILYPLTFLIHFSSKLVLRIFGIKAVAPDPEVTEEEIISIVNEGYEHGVLEDKEAEMIQNIIEMDETQVQEIMTHRGDIRAIEAGTRLIDARNFILQESNSRYPVYQDDLDHIIGIVHLKDIVKYASDDGNLYCSIGQLEGLMREAVFVPETKTINLLFKSMQSSKLQMAIVVDEYGQTTGLVAMEDILEEIVGNILDEYDEEEEVELTPDEDEYIIDGKTLIKDIEQQLGISFPEQEYETINGFMIAKMDRIPEADEDFDVDVEDYNFKILQVQNKMVQSVLVTRLSSEQ